MAVRPIPEGYHTATPYLMVPDVGRQIEFLKKAFGAVETSVARMSDGTVRHADVKIGDSHVMMGAARGEWKAMPCAIYLYVDDTDATYDRAMAAGAESLMEPSDQYYGDRNAGVMDEAGNYWWIATHIEDVSPEEMERRHQEFFAEST